MTSVGLSLPSPFTVSGSPVTSTGTLTGTLTGILGSANGGSANGFFAVAGPATATKTFTFPNADATVLTSNAAVTVAQGGTGAATFTAYSVLTAGTTATGAFQNVSGVGTSGQVLTSNGAGALPTWQAAGGGISGLTTNAIPKAASATTLSDSLLFSGVNANTVEQRSSTTAQKFHVYRTFTSTSNHEKLLVEGSCSAHTALSGDMCISSDHPDGAGTPRDLFLGIKDSGDTVRGWNITASGAHLVPNCDLASCNNTADLGSSGGGSYGWIRDIHLLGKINWGNGSPAGNTLSWASGGDNVLVLGQTNAVQSASRIAGIKPASHTGSNQDGQNFVLSTGIGTGTGAIGTLQLQAAAAGTASGSTAQTLIDRMITGVVKAGLTAGSANTLFDVALPTLSMTGGTVHYTVESTDGTDMQASSGTVTYTAVNKGGTYTSNITLIGAESSSTSVGTLVDTWTVVSGTNKVTIKVTPTVVGITATTLRITYSIHNNGQSAITIQ